MTWVIKIDININRAVPLSNEIYEFKKSSILIFSRSPYIAEIAWDHIYTSCTCITET